MNNGVEFFTPWSWFNGMWEAMHLFSRYAKSISVSSVSSLENTVSAYTTVNESADSMTVIIVNRDMNSTRNVTVNLHEFSAASGSYKTLQLASLPSNETFVSHTQNALKTNSVTVSSNSFTIAVPALSTTAVLLKSIVTGTSNHNDRMPEINVYPNPANDMINIDLKSGLTEPAEIVISDLMGRRIKHTVANFDGFSPVSLDITELTEGVYILSVQNNQIKSVRKFSVVSR